tara:strand:- start:179 stop:529 length:351 start_codon:yes stop_codon:yes gene_type:complete
MSVTREELQNATDTLSKKIDDRHDKIIMKWDELATSINGMNINIGRFLEKFDNQEETNDRTDDSISQIRSEVNLMLVSIVELQTNQKNSKNFWDKFGVPLMLIVFVGLSAINYLKV